MKTSRHQPRPWPLRRHRLRHDSRYVAHALRQVSDGARQSDDRAHEFDDDDLARRSRRIVQHQLIGGHPEPQVPIVTFDGAYSGAVELRRDSRLDQTRDWRDYPTRHDIAPKQKFSRQLYKIRHNFPLWIKSTWIAGELTKPSNSLIAIDFVQKNGPVAEYAHTISAPGPQSRQLVRGEGEAGGANSNPSQELREHVSGGDRRTGDHEPGRNRSAQQEPSHPFVSCIAYRGLSCPNHRASSRSFPEKPSDTNVPTGTKLSLENSEPLPRSYGRSRRRPASPASRARTSARPSAGCAASTSRRYPSCLPSFMRCCASGQNSNFNNTQRGVRYSSQGSRREVIGLPLCRFGCNAVFSTRLALSHIARAA